MGRSRSRSNLRFEGEERDMPRRYRSWEEDQEDNRLKGRMRIRKSRRRSKSRSKSPQEHSLGSILKQRSSTLSCEAARGLEEELRNVEFDIDKISESAKIWLEARVEERVILKIKEVEKRLDKHFTVRQKSIENIVKMKVEREVMEEMHNIRKNEEEQKKKHARLENDLKEKIERAEQKEKEYADERLAMLKERGDMERERRILEKERDAIKKSEQSAILNKGGVSRVPIKFSFGK